MFFFITLSTILFFFCLYLYYNIRKLNKKITELEAETKTFFERNLTNFKETPISIENLSTEIPNAKSNIEEKNNLKKEQEKTTESNNEENNKALYIKSILESYIEKELNNNQLISKKEQTLVKDNKDEIPSKPNNIEIEKNISIPKQPQIVPEVISVPNVTLTDVFNPTDFIKTFHQQISETDSKPIPVANDYLQELSTQLQEEIAPQTIELTGYEKIQEEQAIISYQELLSLKEKIKNQDKQDEQFIETLKELRNLLKNS